MADISEALNTLRALHARQIKELKATETAIAALSGVGTKPTPKPVQQAPTAPEPAPAPAPEAQQAKPKTQLQRLFPQTPYAMSMREALTKALGEMDRPLHASKILKLVQKHRPGTKLDTLNAELSNFKKRGLVTATGTGVFGPPKAPEKAQEASEEAASPESVSHPETASAAH